MLEVCIHRDADRPAVIQELRKFGDVTERMRVRHVVMLDAPVEDIPQLMGITGVEGVEDGDELSGMACLQTHVLTDSPLLNGQCDLMALQALNLDPERVKHDLLYADTTFTRVTGGNDGSGIVLGIVDNLMKNTGHTEFTGRFDGTTIYNGYPSDGDNPHGNYVACVAAGASYGIAPGAEMVNARGLNVNNQGSTSILINGMDAVLTEHETQPEQYICNASWIGSTNLYNATVTDLADSGVPVIAAAGNQGLDLNLATFRYPAISQNSFCVGGIDINRRQADVGESSLNSSNFGTDVNAWAGYGPWWSVDDTGVFRGIFGTSFSAPCASGIAALMLQSMPKMTTLSETRNFYGLMRKNTKLDCLNVDGSPNPSMQRLAYQLPDGEITITRS